MHHPYTTRQKKTEIHTHSYKQTQMQTETETESQMLLQILMNSNKSSSVLLVELAEDDVSFHDSMDLAYYTSSIGQNNVTLGIRFTF